MKTYLEALRFCDRVGALEKSPGWRDDETVTERVFQDMHNVCTAVTQELEEEYAEQASASNR